MSKDTSLVDLVVRWEDLRAQDRVVSVEELCHDCPELIDQIKTHLQALGEMDRLLSADQTAPSSAANTPNRANAGSPSDFRQAAERPGDGWPSIAGYEILDEVSHGGMGVVYKARHLGLDRTVAIKTILPYGSIRGEQKARFLREAKVMALLQHPNIVPIYEIGQHEGHPFLTMEYIDGGTLSQALKGKPLPARKAAELTATLAHAVEHAHAQGVIHRDLKPSNVLLTADGTPKIGDFGVAKCLESAAEQTHTGQLLGTPSYMAPEQLTEDRSGVGFATDVYALGATLYELLSGRPPFLADNAIDTLKMVRSQEPLSLRRLQPKTPRDLDVICLKCLEKEPRRRYQCAQALVDDLDRFLAGKTISARPIGLLERGWRWSRSHPSATTLIVGTTFMLAAILTIVLAFDRRLTYELGYSRAEHQQVLATRKRLHSALTKEVADQLDSDLRELAAVPRTMAAFLEQHETWDEKRLDRSLRQMLLRNPLIFGMCVAMEPFQWQADQKDFALYVYRRSAGLTTRQLLPPLYQPLYRQWAWYRAVKDTSRGRWSEPYIGPGADNTPMVTFSAPIRRLGRFIGVVTADLAIDYFHKLRKHIEQLDLSPNSYCSVVSPRGTILVHRESRYEFPNPESNLRSLQLDVSALFGLAGTTLPQNTGAVEGVDPTSGRTATFLFARIGSTGWVFVIVKER